MINDQGAIVLADAWFAGGFASKNKCITNPESAKGQVTRAAGPMFEEMLVGAENTIKKNKPKNNSNSSSFTCSFMIWIL